MRTEHLKHVGWALYQVVSCVNWCGHAQEIIPLPLADGRVTLRRYFRVIHSATFATTSCSIPLKPW